MPDEGKVETVLEALNSGGEVDNFKDPFQKDAVQAIEFTIEKNVFRDYAVEYKSRVRFKNGDTSGYHHITAEDFPALVRVTHKFIDSL